MAGMDEVVINTRERPLSGDINDIESMIHRNTLDIFRHGLAARSYSAGMPTGSPRNCVLGGLEVVPNGNDVSVNPGALLQDSAVLAPAPGSLDSSYRVGINRAATTIDVPDPVSETYYLIEAQMARVTTVTSSRDILDPVTGIFSPSSVTKQRERRVQFQVLTGGTSAPTPSGGDWVPLAVLRRPAGGGPVTALTDIFDVRPMWDDRLGLVTQSLSTVFSSETDRRGTIRTGWTVDVPANYILLDFCAGVKGAGALGRAALAAADDPTAAKYLEGGTVLTANSWYYLYLCPWNSFLPWNAQNTGYLTRGVLLLSATPPMVGFRQNNAALTLPAPWAYTVPIGAATLVCQLRRDAANAGWVPMYSEDMVDFNMQQFGYTTSTSGGSVLTFFYDYPLPIGNPRTAKVSTAVSTTAATAGQIDVKPIGATNNWIGSVQFGGLRGTFSFEYPVRPAPGIAPRITATVVGASVITIAGWMTGYKL